MYAFRVWKRVHRPFIFVALCCMSVVVIGFTSVAASTHNIQQNLELGNEQSIEKEYDFYYDGVHDKYTVTERMESDVTRDSRHKVLDPQFLVDINGGKSRSAKNDNDVRPIDPVPQLPFCNSNVGGTVNKNMQAGNQNQQADNVDSASDELVPILGNSRALSHPELGLHGRHIVVATLDGQVSLLDHTGQIVWSICTGQLFSSTISNLQLSEDGKLINLIPSLAGGLYKYDGDSLQPMPLNADSLLKKSFKLSNDVVITGGKELRTFGVDVDSGSIRYECGFGDCYYPPQSANEATEVKRPVLVIKKQSQIVRAIDSATGSEKWNFSVGTHEVTIAGLTDPGCNDEDHKSGSKANVFLKIIIPDGLVIGADGDNKVLWQQRFTSPISQAWVVENGHLKSIDTLRSSPLLAEEPALYVGIHKQQLYVQESQSTAEKVEQLFHLDNSPSGSLLADKPDRLKLEWKTSYAATANNENTALTSFTPPPNWGTVPFKPFYVFERDEVRTTQMPAIVGGSPYPYVEEEKYESDADSDSDDNGAFHLPEFEDDDGAIQIIFVSLWYFWKEILGISLLTAVLVNILLMRPMIRAVRTQTMREMLAVFRFSKNKEKEEEKALVVRRPSDKLELPVRSPITERHRSVSTSSNTSQVATLEDTPFSSPYLTDFKPIQCLGQGGFGMVFEAMKKIDGRHYAVKRIPMPNNEKSDERVKREVIALAKLDHKNIVRYFHAWIEKPPQGWLEKNDPLWTSSVGSCSPTMDYPSDSAINTSSIGASITNRKKPDHSKVSVPNTPSEDLNDSYITFATQSQASSSYITFENDSAFHNSKVSDWTMSQKENSIIPISEENSTSSASGKGFYCRPVSLNIPSPISEISDGYSSHTKANDDENVENAECSSQSCTVMYLYIQQELCQKRTLQDWLRAEKSRNVQTVVKFFAQIVEAVGYVHSKQLIHRDLKPSNVFLAGDSYSDSSIIVKIGDFGLATTALSELETDGQGSESPNDSVKSTSKVNLTRHVGTHLYMSPEQYRKKLYDYKVDIYSLGLIFFELLVPFSTDMERYDILSKVKKLAFPDYFKEQYPIEYEQIREMVSHDPTTRPDATKIKEWATTRLETLSSSQTRI